jgi:hypothetical protein
MKSTHSLFLVFVVTWLFAAPLSMSADALPPGKNWLGPTHKIYAQQLADQIMKPGAAPNTYTMYAGSFPDRIGNIDDPDDVMVTEKGITILDPRWHKTKDAQRKYVVMTPLRDAAGENIGLLVLAYKNPSNSGRGDHYFLVASTALRDRLQAKIPNAAALFAPAKN